MPVKISGDGTITGLAVGGLPDGTVDEDTLANLAVGTGKLANNAVTPAKSTIVGGITHYDLWRLTSNFAGEKNPVDTNLVRASEAHLGLIGDPMTQSSGIFTFPTEGIWRILNQREAYLNADDREVRIEIYTSVDSGSNWSKRTENATHISRSESQNTHVSMFATCMFDVTDKTQCRIKFRHRVNNNSTNTIGSTTMNRTYFEFMRLGDT